MRKVLWGALIVALSLTLLISGSSCTKTVYVTVTPAPTSACGPTPTPTSTQSQVLGTELIYQADLSQIGNESAAEAMLGAIAIITRRVDAYGISEAVVQKLGSDQIVVQLPGGSDVEGAINLIGTTAQLEFKEMVYDSNGNPVLDSNGNPEWIPATAVDSSGQEVPLTGRYLKNNAQVVFAANTNAPEVAFEFNSEGATLFSEITGCLIGKPLGIFLDNQLISSPTVKAQIGASGVINNIPLNDAKILVIELNAGALPCPLKLIWRHSLTPNPTPTPTSTPAPLNVDDSYSGAQVELSVGQSLMVTLPSNVTTGYSWSLAQNSDESVLSKMGNEYIAPQTTFIGAGGTEVWTFQALKEGTSSISMEYRRPWETGVPPAVTFSLTVVVRD